MSVEFIVVVQIQKQFCFENFKILFNKRSVTLSKCLYFVSKLCIVRFYPVHTFWGFYTIYKEMFCFYSTLTFLLHLLVKSRVLAPDLSLCPLIDPHPVASHLDLQSAPLAFFQWRHRSSAKGSCSCWALRVAAIFPVTLRSATPSGAGACSSVRLPESCVWMHVKHKQQTREATQPIQLVLLHKC